jgi:hemoglobin
VQCVAEQIGRETIYRVVDRFYSQIQTHPTLAGPFSHVEDWPHHKERLTYFWWVVLGGARTRQEQYDPVTKHFNAGFSPELLADWLVLFGTTVEQQVPAPLAAAWLEVAGKIGDGLVLANAAYAGRKQER